MLEQQDGWAKNRVFNFERSEEEEEDGPASRSILGLEGIRPSASAPAAAAPPPDEDPPNTSILGLGGIRASKVPFVLTAPRPEDEPPTRSFLGLEVIPSAHLSSPGVSPGADGEPPSGSILGLRGIRPSARPPAPAEPRPSGEPATRPFFDEGIQADLFPLAPAVPRTARRAGPAEIEVPEFERDVQHRLRTAFPVERGILISLVAHVLFLLIFLSAPLSVVPDPRKGFLAAFLPPEKSPEEKIPVIFKEFRESPGPARENPKRSPLSDATRRASGGDPSRQRLETPFIPERPGKQGLEPGSAAVSPPPRPASGKGGEKQAAAAPDEKEKGGADAFRVPPPGRNSSGAEGGKLAGLDQAIQDAARGVERQSDGAGFPNPEGGFVDSGPLSFDTTWYDWGPYAEEMVRRIRLHWEIPELARLGWKGKLTIRFFILADGRVEGATMLSRSGIPPFDHAALQAILTSSPFRPLPQDLLKQVPGKDREGITVTFFYNIRPGQDGQGAGAR